MSHISTYSTYPDPIRTNHPVRATPISMPSLRSRTAREVALPASGLTILREALSDEAGPVATVNALHAAGFRSGERIWAEMDRDLGAMPGSQFWTWAAEWFSRRGWGTLTFEPVHEAVGRLSSPDWAEADGAQARQPSCSFTTGLFASLLTAVAGGEVAVVEIACRARGDAVCEWVFGSEATVLALHRSLLEGRTFEEALAEI